MALGTTEAPSDQSGLRGCAYFLLHFFKYRGGRDRRVRLANDCQSRSIKDVDSRMCADTVGVQINIDGCFDWSSFSVGGRSQFYDSSVRILRPKKLDGLAVCGISRGLFSVWRSEIHRGSEIFSLPDKRQIPD